ncbi:hypothetical protein SEA_BEARBQ_35 [Gordonia phage BearBQ]|uniref:Uncharacterized protein n=3 Tax=Caudoviricetes TaxID=2731619 RepID=A0A345L143_9CAUD|nr:hypothetical protein HOT72_gp035 [Gordonia phage Apricot]YP_009818651.1 hypothetical protein HOU97_gp35 [Gordonia phage Kenna]QCG77193.1 hypothetical protein SEA_LUTUM_36 [Gordonia phage Lutum]WNM74437.1 hypothetical protein SEA_BEARBQ_35 [Gordonia phage BearBQ]AXH48995.1 hypothetical protein SEA_APRICOT_35 [Gordonia phage Apricot]AZS12312.1 hypothetical protein SEA_KENNA_35 [Gordonia phage Kenna]
MTARYFTLWAGQKAPAIVRPKESSAVHVPDLDSRWTVRAMSNSKSLKLTPEEILRAAEEALSTAEFGYEALTGDRSDWRRPGLRTAIAFGNSVTEALRKLRSHAPDFEEWYAPRTVVLAADPELKRLYNMRSEMLHEGVLVSGVNIVVGGPTSITIVVDGNSVPAEPLIRRYLDALAVIVRDAREEFVPAPTT